MAHYDYSMGPNFLIPYFQNTTGKEVGEEWVEYLAFTSMKYGFSLFDQQQASLFLFFSIFYTYYNYVCLLIVEKNLKKTIKQ